MRYLLLLLVWAGSLPTSQAAEIVLSFYGHPVPLLAVAALPLPVCNSSPLIAQQLHAVEAAQQENFARLRTFGQTAKLDGMATYLLLTQATQRLGYDPTYAVLFHYAFLQPTYDVLLEFTPAGNLKIGYHTTFTYSGFYSRHADKTYSFLAQESGLTDFYVYALAPRHCGTQVVDFTGIPACVASPPVRKTYTFRLPASSHSEQLTFSVDTLALRYYRALPKILTYPTYAHSTPSAVFGASVQAALAPRLLGLTTSAQVQYLLSFVQSLPYATLNGKRSPTGKLLDDPFYYPEESLFYQATDCEDRAFLLAYLVLATTQLTPYLLDYRDHLSVSFTQLELGPDFVPRYTFPKDGRRFVLAETTTTQPLGEAVAMAKPFTIISVVRTQGSTR